MIAKGKRSILGVLVDAIDYEAVVEQVASAAQAKRGFAVCTAAVHGVIEGALSAEQKFRLNHVDVVTPDGQPVRWAMRLLHGVKLGDRVYGPKLMLRICERAQRENVGIYFYGSTPEILRGLKANLRAQFPGLNISGCEPSRFRSLSLEERQDLVRRVKDSGASIMFVGLGCPRQDVWSYEYRDLLSMPIIAVGGAFGVAAGKVRQPEWMQARGLEWLFRLTLEPKRLWRRYLLLNPIYTVLVCLQATGLRHFEVGGRPPASELLHG